MPVLAGGASRVIGLREAGRFRKATIMRVSSLTRERRSAKREDVVLGGSQIDGRVGRHGQAHLGDELTRRDGQERPVLLGWPPACDHGLAPRLKRGDEG
jgi:hypothetical protein